MLENPVFTIEDSALQKSTSLAPSCPQHTARVLSNSSPANASITMTRSDSHRITIPGGKRRVETSDANSTVEVPPKRPHNAPYDPMGQQITSKRRSMYIPHKSQSGLPDAKLNMQSSFNSALDELKPTFPLSITQTPVSIATYRSCITCLTPISAFDEGEVCPSCRMSLSVPTGQQIPVPQSWPDPNSLSKDAMSVFLDGQDVVKRRQKVESSNIQLTHPREFAISPPRQPIIGSSTSSKRRKVSHNKLEQDILSVRNMDESNSTPMGSSAKEPSSVAASNRDFREACVTEEQPTQGAQKRDISGILKLSRSRRSIGAKKVSWADISGDGDLEIGPSYPVSCVKIEESDTPLESTSAEGPKRSLTIKIKPLRSLPPQKPCDTDGIEGWDSDLTELSESDDENSSESDVPRAVSEIRSDKSITGLKIRLPPRKRDRNTRVCASSRCRAELASDYRWKSCVLCRSRNREYQRKRQNLQGRHWRLEDELTDVQAGPSTTSDAEASAVEGARLCLMRRCSFIIPPMDEYASKFCSLCRLFRKSKKALGMNLGAGSKDGANGVRLAFTAALHDLPRKAKPSASRCIYADCGMSVSSPPSKSCEQCHHRNRFIIRWVSEALRSQLPEGTTLQCDRLEPPIVFEYLSLKPLLADLRSRARSFLRSQALFFLFNELASPDVVRAAFAFEGEFTTVNPDLDIASQKDDIHAKVLELKKIIEQEINIQFSPEESHQFVDDGFQINFHCDLKVPVLEAIKNGDAVEIKPGTKDMKGKLNISVLKDSSHPFIPGEKRVIRFHMIG